MKHYFYSLSKHLLKEKRFAWLLALGMHGLLLILLIMGLDWKTQTPTPIQAELWSALPPIQATPSPPANPETTANDASANLIDDADISLPTDNPVTPTASPSESAQVNNDAPSSSDTERTPLPTNTPVQPSKSNELLNQLQKEVLKLSAKSDKPKSNLQITSTGSDNVDDPNYIDLLRTCIYNGVIYNANATIQGNPTVEFRIKILPDGKQAEDPTLLASSGYPNFDKAVEDGIRKCNPLPRPAKGKFPSSVELSYEMFLR